jgi:hypothetical protein
MTSQDSGKSLDAGEGLERETGFEPATSSLGSWHSTPELLPLHVQIKSIPKINFAWQDVKPKAKLPTPPHFDVEPPGDLRIGADDVHIDCNRKAILT